MILVLTTLKLEELKEKSTYGTCKFLDSNELYTSLYNEYSESVSNPDHLEFMVNMEISTRLKNSIKNCKNGCLVYRISKDFKNSSIVNIITFVETKCNNVDSIQIYDNPKFLKGVHKRLLNRLAAVEYHPNL